MNLQGTNRGEKEKNCGSKINERELLQMLGTYGTETSVPPFHGMIMKFAWNLCSISSDFLPIPVPTTTPLEPPSPPPTHPPPPPTITSRVLTRPQSNPNQTGFCILTHVHFFFLTECSYVSLWKLCDNISSILTGILINYQGFNDLRIINGKIVRSYTWAGIARSV